MSDKQIKEIMSRLHNDLLKGLGKDSHAQSIVKCFITYIQDLPNGKGNIPINFVFKFYLLRRYGEIHMKNSSFLFLPENIIGIIWLKTFMTLSIDVSRIILSLF